MLPNLRMHLNVVIIINKLITKLLKILYKFVNSVYFTIVDETCAFVLSRISGRFVFCP